MSDFVADHLLDLPIPSLSQKERDYKIEGVLAKKITFLSKKSIKRHSSVTKL